MKISESGGYDRVRVSGVIEEESSVAKFIDSFRALGFREAGSGLVRLDGLEIGSHLSAYCMQLTKLCLYLNKLFLINYLLIINVFNI